MLTSGALDPSSRGHDDTVRLRRRRQPSRCRPLAPPLEPGRPSSRRRLADADARAARRRAPSLPEPPGSGRAGWMIAAAIVLLPRGRRLLTPTPTTSRSPKPASPRRRRCATPAPPRRHRSDRRTRAKKSVRETVAEYLATNPAPDAMLAKGKEFAQAGEMNGAFLVWRRAAEAGSAPAQLELAAFYDPLGDPAEGPAASRPTARAPPTGTSARRWPAMPRRSASSACCWPRAAPACRPTRVAPGRWLQQAAAQNDAEAKKALETLPK